VNVAPTGLDTLTTLFLRPRTQERLAAFRDRRVRDLVGHACRNVPYYERLFADHGIRPEDINGVRDLWKVPVTTRRTLQRLLPEEIVARGIDPDALIEAQSSGSTGRRLRVRRTWSEERVLRALRNRVGRRRGRRPWERGARLEIPERLRPHDHRRPGVFLPRLGLYDDRSIDCLAEPASIIERLRALRPSVIGGFPPVLFRIARHAGDGGLADLGVRTIVVGGEVLTPAMRQRITAAFNAPVHENYGSIEFVQMAWQCPVGEEMHLCDDTMVLEVLRDGRPVAEGEVGEVVATGLHSYAMPLIRYQIGDLATQGAPRCSCGAQVSTIRGVRGRMLDYFPLPGGRIVHPYELTMPMMAAHAWIEQYQLTQELVDRVVLRIVPGGQPSNVAMTQLRRQYAESLGAEVTFEVHLVDDLDLDANGKCRVSRSLVRSPYDEPADETP